MARVRVVGRARTNIDHNVVDVWVWLRVNRACEGKCGGSGMGEG